MTGIAAMPEKTMTMIDSALSIARRAVNGWACYASRNVEHAEIRRLHGEISDFAAPPQTVEPPAPAWQPIEAWEPKEFETVLGFAVDEIRTTHWDSLESAWMKDRAYQDAKQKWNPTHIMPLPSAPERR